RASETSTAASSRPGRVRRPRAGVVVEVIRSDSVLKLRANELCARLTSSAYVLRSLAASPPPHDAAPRGVSAARRTGMILRIGREATRSGPAGSPVAARQVSRLADL